MKLLLLDAAGMLVAVVLGLVVFFFGGENGQAYLLLILAFLAASVIATKYGTGVKRKLALYEYNRGWENVVANGIVPVFCVLAAYSLREPMLAVGAYVGSLAAVTADKFSSEIGVLGGAPRRLFDFKEAKRGESGAISLLGTLASFNGALVVGLASYFLFPARYDAWGVLMICSIGALGSFVDSIFGIFETRGIGNKMTTNIVCAVFGAILGYFIL
ncbi:MAG: DUF92 domain-containing protein [Candidatus Micrarchaeota archaeon]